MNELLVKITPTGIEAWLSVDGGEFRPLGTVETARMLSDLACASTACVLADYEGPLVSVCREN